MRLLKYIALVIFWGGIFLPLTHAATTGAVARVAPIGLRNEGPIFGGYTETVHDMKVKVQGGYVYVTRTWEKGEWRFNRQWTPLREVFNSGQLVAVSSSGTSSSGTSSLSGGTVASSSETPPGAPTLMKDDMKFTWVSGNTYVSETDPQQRILKTATGWRWEDKRGNSIDYDADRNAVAYSDRNNNTVTLQWDASGKLTGVLDPLNKQVLWYEYNTDNRVSRVRDYTNRQVTYTYSGSKLSSITDVLGNPWTYTYAGNNLKTKTDPEGRVTTINYGGAVVTEIVHPDGNKTTFKNEYDKTKKQFYKQTRSPAGKITEVWYDKDGDLIRRDINGMTVLNAIKDSNRQTEVDAAGNKTIKDYDQWQNLLKITYADGSTKTMSYDPVYNNVTQETNENGVTTKYEYDTNGNLIRKTEAVGKSEQRVTEYTYDSHGNMLTKKKVGDALTQEAVSTYTYDDYGSIATFTDAEGGVTKYTRDVLGNVLVRTDPRNKNWTFTYDAKGQVLTKSTPLGYTTQYQYDKVGNRVKLIEANATTTFSYDLLDRMVKKVLPSGLIVETEYNLDGKPLKKIEDKQTKKIFEYDELDRLIKINFSTNYSIAYSYKGVSDYIESITYPTYKELRFYVAGKKRVNRISVKYDDQVLDRFFTYDGVGNVIEKDEGSKRSLVSVFDAFGRKISYFRNTEKRKSFQYDSRNNLLSITNAKGVVIRQYEYDRANHLIKESHPDGSSVSYQYTDGKRTVKIDAKGQVERYIYDDDGRVVQSEFYLNTAASTPSKTVTYTYDALNRIVGYEDGTSSASYTYDAMNHKTNITVNFGSFSKGYSYAYYNNGRRKSYTDPEGVTYNYQYNDNNQLVRLDIPGQGAITINRYDWSVPAEVTLPGGSKIITNYNGLLQPTQILAKDPAGNKLLDYQYSYDELGNVLGKITEHGTYTYSYDELERLINADNPVLPDESFTYDVAGNRLTSADTTGTWNYNNLNQLLSDTVRDYTYDANGNLTEIKQGVSTLNTYIYNLENRLSEIKDGSNQTVASYTYDPFGRRISKTVGGQSTYFLYADEGLIGEYSAVGVLLRGYGYSLARGWTTKPLYQKTAGNIYYYINDYIGTPQKLISSTGAMEWSVLYAAFGKDNVQIENVTNPLRFPGQYKDNESGYFYNYYRFYDHKLGRYISSDPIDVSGGINTYLYAENNPANKTDSFGLDTAGCDGVPDSWETPCRLECCAKHDQCYHDNNCTSESWYKDCGAACDKCNSDVKDCFVDCGFSDDDDPDKPNYYCARQGRYIRIPGDFPDYETAKKACST